MKNKQQKDNRAIIIEELKKKIITEFDKMRYDFIVVHSHVSETPEQAFNRTLEEFATNLLSKLNGLDRGNTKKVLQDLVVSTLADSDGCLLFKTDYDEYIDQILQLIPEQGEVENLEKIILETDCGKCIAYREMKEREKTIKR